MNDTQYLLQAIELAEKSDEPVKCACIIVQDGNILAAEYNSQRADQVVVHHAEIKAVYQANRKTGSRTLPYATAYCSCEPCSMCLSALSLAKIKRIVFRNTMADISPDAPMARLNSREFAEKYLNFVPKIEQLLV